MGKYDIDKYYTADCQLTFAELANEISEEQCGEKDYDNLYRKLIDGSSGVVTVLKNKFDFDIAAYAGDDIDKRFKMLQFVKMLVYAEKFDAQASCLMLLQKPNLENMTTEYSEYSKNNDIYRLIYSRTLDLIIEEEAEKRWAAYHKVNQLLEEKIGIARLRISTLIDKKDFNLEYLNEVKVRLSYFANEFEKIYSEKNLIHDGIAECFFDLLVCYPLKSNDASKIYMNSQYHYTDIEEPTESYIRRYCEEFYIKVGKDGFKAVEQKLECKESEFGNKIWNLITYDAYNWEDIRHYNYAVKNYNTMIDFIFRSVTRDKNYEYDDIYNPYSEPIHKIIKKFYNDDFDIRDNIPVGIFVSIMQELIYISKNKIEFENRYYKYKDTSRTLTSKLSKGEKNEAAAIRYFIRRYENRLAANIGRRKQMEIWREIENDLYKIKMTLFSIYNIAEFLVAYKQIYSLISLL